LADLTLARLVQVLIAESPSKFRGNHGARLQRQVATSWSRQCPGIPI